MEKRKCSFCDNENVVLISGYNYCISCSRRLDRSAIHTVISKFYSPLTMDNIKELCTEMFGTKDYCFSMFPKLYTILDRGQWIFSKHRYKITTTEYLIKVFKEFVKQNHPKIYERINHE